MQIPNFQNDTRKFIAQKENFYIMEYQHDASVSPAYAEIAYFMGKMGVRRR